MVQAISDAPGQQLRLLAATDRVPRRRSVHQDMDQLVPEDGDAEAMLARGAGSYAAFPIRDGRRPSAP